MLYNALQLTLPIVELLLLMGVSFYLISLSYSWINGAPYVGTQNKEIYEIVNKIRPQKNLNFVELGCGDGRVVKSAVKQFHLYGTGIDINPFLIWFCKISAKMQGIKNITFYSKNVLDVDLRNADIIYIFLFPALVKKLENNLLHKTKKNVIIISHGFKIPYLEKYVFDTRQGRTFSTYYYRIK